MSRAWPCVVGLALAAAMALTPCHLRAAEEGGSPSVPAGAAGVRVYVVGALGRDQDLMLSLDQIKAPRGTGPPIRIWLVALSGRHARLYFAEPDTERYLVRDIPVPSGFDELGRERIVQVVLSSTLAFRDQAASSSLQEVEEAISSSVDTPRPQTPAPLPPQRPSSDTVAGLPGGADRDRQRPSGTVREPRPWQSLFGVGAVYGVTGKGEENTAQGPGLTLELGRSRGSHEYGFRVQGQYRLPHEASSDRIRLSIQEVVTAGSITAQVQPDGVFGWRLELGGGIQFVHFTPRAMVSDVVAREARWDTRPFLLVGTGPAWHTRSMWVRVTARLDWQLSRTRYEIATGAGPRPELLVQRIQPGAFVELGGAPIHF
jgi:hypothetical protein